MRNKPADFIHLPQQTPAGQGITPSGYPELDILPVVRYFRNKITNPVDGMNAG